MKIRSFVIAILFSGLFNTCLATEAVLTQREDIKTFINQMVEKHQFDRKTLNAWFQEAKLQPSIITAMTKPAEKLPWYRYETIFLSPKRIQEGVTFWKENQADLDKAYAQYAIPPEIIVSIIGVETFYGKNCGNYRVLDSLVTLGFDYPPRSTFFLSELEQFFLLAREQGWDLTQIKGSYAGAMGKGQFMPSSYRKYAVDFSQSGKRDLLNSNSDSIGSVANYFKSHGWEPYQVIVIPARVKGKEYQQVIASKANPKPVHTLQDLSKRNVTSVERNADWEKLPFALMRFEVENGEEFWLGAQNFYVITRYNHSDHYAMAVYNLSQEIKTAYQKS